MERDRRILFEGIANARDLGGIRAADGRRIRRGMLLRTGNLSAATEADRKQLQEPWKLSLVVDLRTSNGRRRKPDAKIPGVMYRGVPVFEEEMLGISHGGMGENFVFAGQPLPKMEKLYRNIVLDPGCMAQLEKALYILMTHDFSAGSALWHCSEGKDRCGMVAAFLLTALGADPDTIMEDYLISNETGAPKAQGYYDLFLAEGRGQEAAEAVRDAFLVKESYLRAAFDAVSEKYGSVGAYLTEGLKVPETLIREFREKVLE